MLMRRSFKLIFLCISICLLLANVTPECWDLRERKSWSSLTYSEKSLYREAITLAMQRGYHILFMELHNERQTATVAHTTCAFLYWHRRFLLGYENMLRSLGPKFECVTIPYWNYFEEYVDLLDGRCNSLTSCADIVQFFGGTKPKKSHVRVHGSHFLNCVEMANFCHSSHPSQPCLKCIPRNNTDHFPCGVNYASLRRNLTSISTFRELNHFLQRNFHNEIHNIVGGFMATNLSPADPIFYSHHATIDMVLDAYIKCGFRSKRLTKMQLQTSPYAFEPCGANFTKSPEATSEVFMRWANLNDKTGNQSDPQDVSKHDVLKQYFDPIPNKYYQLVDISDFNTTSYSYATSTLIEELWGSNHTCGQPPIPLAGKELRITKWFNKACKKEQNYWHPRSFTKLIPEANPELLDRMEILAALYHKQHYGLYDYSPTIRRHMHVQGHAHCNQILHDAKALNVTIRDNEWKTLYNFL